MSHGTLNTNTQHASDRIPFEERLTCSAAEACTAVGLRSKIYQLIGGRAVETVLIEQPRLVRIPSSKWLLSPNQ
jgi:hypothetical protein